MPPAGLVLTGIVSVQIGAGLATRLFAQAAPATVTGIRLWTSAVALGLIVAKPAARTAAAMVRDRAWIDAAVAIGFGLALAGMNFSIYQAMDRIPLGIAVTIEFLGPLAVAVAASRRAIDLLWVALAGTGVALLSGESPGGGLALAGVGFALLAAAGWAAYILLSAATGRRFGGSSGLAIAMTVAAVAITPAAVGAAGTALGRPDVWLIGAGVGLLSSVIPYRLELEALRRVPARVFGIWMSLEPAVAALVGLVLLSQSLAAAQWVAVGCVMVACAGAARGRRPGPDPAGPASTAAVSTESVSPGPDTAGPDTTGPVTTGPVTTGPVTTGPVTTGPVTTGPDGRERDGPDLARTGRRGPARGELPPPEGLPPPPGG